MFVLLDRAAECSSKLPAAVGIEWRHRQQRLGVRGLVAEIAINRSVCIVGPGLRNHVDDPAQRASVLSAETVVDDAEFRHCLLRWSRALRACALVNVVSPIHGDGVAQITHSAKRNSRGIWLGESGLQTRP